MNFNFFIFFIILKKFFSLLDRNKIIISFSSNKDNISNANKVIYSILDQNVDHSLYLILLILSEKEFKGNL